MRSPSGRILSNTVDLYVAATSQDGEGGFQQSYTDSPTATVPCSVQYTGTAEMVDHNRVTIVNTYTLFFDRSTHLTTRDRIVWLDPVAGISHTLFTDGVPPAEAGKDSTYTVRCIEKI